MEIYLCDIKEVTFTCKHVVGGINDNLIIIVNDHIEDITIPLHKITIGINHLHSSYKETPRKNKRTLKTRSKNYVNHYS